MSEEELGLNVNHIEIIGEEVSNEEKAQLFFFFCIVILYCSLFLLTQHYSCSMRFHSSTTGKIHPPRFLFHCVLYFFSLFPARFHFRSLSSVCLCRRSSFFLSRGYSP